MFYVDIWPTTFYRCKVQQAAVGNLGRSNIVFTMLLPSIWYTFVNGAPVML